MIRRRSGVILMLSASPARTAIATTGGFGVACAAIEGLSRTLAAELSPQGIRVVCLRSHRISGTLRADPDIPVGEGEDFQKSLENMTLLKRLADAGRRREHGSIPGFRQCRRNVGSRGESHLRDERGLKVDQERSGMS